MRKPTLRQAPASIAQIERRAGFATTKSDRGKTTEPNESGANRGVSSNHANDSGEIRNAAMGKNAAAFSPHTPRTSSYLDRAADFYADLAGVGEVSRLKSAVSDASSALDSSSAAVARLREELEGRVAEHESLERRHHDMMQRRHEWGAGPGEEEKGGVDAVAEEFARLTAEEGRARRARNVAGLALRDAEEEFRRKQAEYLDTMRRRYHEEQLWQEKWRVLGTYGTWALIGLNSVIFLGGQALHFKREEDRLSAIAEIISDRTEHLLDSSSNRVHGDGVVSDSKYAALDEGCGGRNQLKDSNGPQSESGTSTQLEGSLSSDETAADHVSQNEGLREDKSLEIPSSAAKSKLGSAVSNLHWPSAAAGAVAASVAILASMLMSRK